MGGRGGGGYYTPKPQTSPLETGVGGSCRVDQAGFQCPVQLCPREQQDRERANQNENPHFTSKIEFQPLLFDTDLHNERVISVRQEAEFAHRVQAFPCRLSLDHLWYFTTRTCRTS